MQEVPKHQKKIQKFQNIQQPLRKPTLSCIITLKMNKKQESRPDTADHDPPI